MICLRNPNPPDTTRATQTFQRCAQALQKHEALRMTIDYVAKGTGPVADHSAPANYALTVTMAKGGRVRIDIRSEDEPVGGVLIDRDSVVEWDDRTKRWTRSKRDTKVNSARIQTRLLTDPSLRTAISPYLQSWVDASPYELIAEGSKQADSVKTANEKVNGRSCMVLTLKRSMQLQGPLWASETARIAWDEQSLLPVMRESITESTAREEGKNPITLGESSKKHVYSDITPNAPLDPTVFEYNPPKAYEFIEPDHTEKLGRAPLPANLRPVKVRSLDGEKIRLVDDRHDAPGIVVVWATWCRPCKYELRALEALRQQDEFKNLRVIAVSVDKDEAKLRKHLKENPLSFAVAHERNWRDRFALPGLPTTVVFDRQGVVRWTHTGWGADPQSNEDSLAELRAALASVMRHETAGAG